MKKWMSVVVVVLFLAAAATVHAQQGNRGQGGGTGGGFLSSYTGGASVILRNAEVKAAIGLTEDQVAKLEEAMALPTERQQFSSVERQTRQEATLEKVEKILSAEQLKKAHVFAFQAAGGLDGFSPRANSGGGSGFGFGMTSAISNTFAMSSLGLTAPQKKELQDVLAKETEKMREFRPTGGNTGGGPPTITDEQRAKITELRAETKAAVLKFLTNEQKVLAKKLMDDAPDFVKPQRGRSQ